MPFAASLGAIDGTGATVALTQQLHVVPQPVAGKCRTLVLKPRRLAICCLVIHGCKDSKKIQNAFTWWALALKFIIVLNFSSPINLSDLPIAAKQLHLTLKTLHLTFTNGSFWFTVTFFVHGLWFYTLFTIFALSFGSEGAT